MGKTDQQKSDFETLVKPRQACSICLRMTFVVLVVLKPVEARL